MIDVAELPVPPSALARLRATFDGELLLPGDAGYDDRRRVWNRMIDRRPAVIARCAGPADVQRAIAFARDSDLPISVRGGGHSVAGLAVVDGGMMIDCSPLKAITVDRASRIVVVEPGALLGELDAATEPHGLAVPAGIVSETGVAGLTLGGGIGWLMRRDGLTCDRLRAADVVTADGQLLRVDPTANHDLFWALRGGGGNFGVVTRFVFEAVPVGRVTAGVALFGIEEAGSVIRRYRGWAQTLPREATTILALRTVLASASMPAALHGRRVLSIGLCHAGEAAAGERLADEIRGLGTVLHDTIGPSPFRAHQQISNASVPAGLGYYWKSHFLGDLDDGVIEALVEHTAIAPQPWSYTIVFQLGGAIADLPAEATAYPERDAGFAMNINGISERPADDDAAIAWTRRLFAATEPSSTGGVYVNFVGREGEKRVRAAYGPAYPRLARIKARWDPDNVFRTNQNVVPGSS